MKYTEPGTEGIHLKKDLGKTAVNENMKSFGFVTRRCRAPRQMDKINELKTG